MDQKNNHDETVERPSIANVGGVDIEAIFKEGMKAITDSYADPALDKKSKRELTLKFIIGANDPEARSLNVSVGHSVKLPNPITQGGHLKRTPNGELFQMKESGSLFSPENVVSMEGNSANNNS